MRIQRVIEAEETQSSKHSKEIRSQLRVIAKATLLIVVRGGLFRVGSLCNLEGVWLPAHVVGLTWTFQNFAQACQVLIPACCTATGTLTCIQQLLLSCLHFALACNSSPSLSRSVLPSLADSLGRLLGRSPPLSLSPSYLLPPSLPPSCRGLILSDLT